MISKSNIYALEHKKMSFPCRQSNLHPVPIPVTTSSEPSLFPMSGDEVTQIEEPGCYEFQCPVEIRPIHT